MVEVYAGLDISHKSTHVCVVDGSGGVAWSGACATDPEVIARTLNSRAPGVMRAAQTHTSRRPTQCQAPKPCQDMNSKPAW